MPRRENRGPRICVFPGYNWCGPGCNGPGEPINEVDAACKAHDKCYRGYGDRCKCDSEFLRRLRPHINQNSEKGRRARTLYNYMKIQTRFTCNNGRR